MMDSMSTPQISLVQLYAVFVTIGLVVSVVAATKKKKTTTNAMKKAEDLKHYSVNSNDLFSSNMNSLSFTVEGEPVSLKRVATGKNGGRYDSQKWTKKSFDNAFGDNLVIHDTPLCKLGTAEVKLDATFTFTKRVVRNDIDNLVKFLLDCLETTEVFDNDAQVMDLVVRKRRGHRNMTAVKITRKAAMDDDDEVIVIN
mmetsp:Transcript_24372/g.27192  ORF Transcript_24372/g.27192 Transcript_24372/m.27192 type:complete len:198 (-) Transcript_24372:10-603(-)